MTLSQRVPSCLANYSIISRIGNGGYGSVYSAVHIPTNSICAIKVINITQLSDVQREKVMREIEILSSFDHAFIVKIYEYFIDDFNIYIVMEYCEKGSLLDFLNRTGKVLNERETAVIFLEVLIDLLHIHNLNIVHRDLKLENILLDSYGHVRLSDFGFSRVLNKEESKQNLTYCGSPVYAAPEMLKRNPYSEMVDVWSFGVILYALLYGKFPFYSDNLKEMVKQIVVCEPEFTDKVSEDANDLLSKMLQKDPCKRISLVEIYTHPFTKRYSSILGSCMDNINSLKFMSLNHWTFPQLESKIATIAKTPIDQIKAMVKNYQINGKTAIFKIIRDNFIKDSLYSKFGEFENHYVKPIPRSLFKIQNETLEVTSLHYNKVHLLKPGLKQKNVKKSNSYHNKNDILIYQRPNNKITQLAHIIYKRNNITPPLVKLISMKS